MKLTTILIFAIVLLLSLISATSSSESTFNPAQRPQPQAAPHPQPDGRAKNKPKRPPVTTTTTTTPAPVPIPECVKKFKSIKAGRPTNQELSTVSELLYNMDDSNVDNFVTINYQNQYSPSGPTPNLPLIQTNGKLYDIPTAKKLYEIHDKQHKPTTINDFLDEVIKTRVMRCAMLYLQKKKIVAAGPEQQKQDLKAIWLTKAPNNGPTGFKHVFFGHKMDSTKVVGLHNWIIFGEREKQGQVKYNGWKKQLPIYNNVAVLKYTFNWGKANKPSNSMFIGTSPELEMALYTICFFTRADSDCPLVLNGKTFDVKTVSFKHSSGKNILVTAFPVI